MLILTIFSQKSAILKNFPILKVKNMGKVFHKFFADWGYNIIFWAEYSPMFETKINLLIQHQQ